MNIDYPGKVEFDALGRTVAQGQPLFAEGFQQAFMAQATPRNPTLSSYDVLGRTTLTILPDQERVQSSYGFEEGLLLTTVTDPELKVKKVLKDVRGNIRAVKEKLKDKWVTTRYAYDPISQIKTVIDDQSNRTGVDYDLAGRRIAIDNPDTGLVEYRFDLSGNLTEKITPNLRARQKSIRYSYDRNRLLRIDYPDMASVSYTYGDKDARQYNQVGRIVSVANGDLMEERFYGELGETVKTVKSIRSDAPSRTWSTYTTEYLFDYLGRMRQLTYPDGEVLTYTYDQGGLLASATGVKQKTTYPYLKELVYDEYGQRVRLQLGNGVVTRYQYDARTRRLDHILSLGADGEVLQNIDYDYDKVGNITGTENAAFVTADNFVRNVTQTYQYDDLHRLVQADGSYAIGDKHHDNYRNTFDYDSIGNFRQKDQRHWFEDPTSGQQTERPHSTYAYAYAYQSAQPHAPSHVGDMSYDYDANGNLIQRTEDQSGKQRIIDWNEENRITRILDQGKETVFRYDDAGTRIVKSGKYGETVYVDANYSIRNGEVASKHIFAGSTRIATKLVMQENRSGGSKQASRPRTVATTAVTAGIDTAGSDTTTDTTADAATATTATAAAATAAADSTGPTAGKNKTTATGLPGRSEKGLATALANGNGHKYGLYKHLDRLGYTVTDDKQIVPKETGGDGGGMLDPVRHGNTRPEEQQIYYYHGDHLGSSNVVTDRLGRTYEHLEYFPYGETWVEESRNQTNLPYKFTSKELDPETGLYYFGARYYDPRVSVWVSVDPIFEKYLSRKEKSAIFFPVALGVYSYSNSSPIVFIDPNGKEAFRASRDLNTNATLGIGVHSFPLIVTDNPQKYGKHSSKFQQFTNNTGNFPNVPKGQTFYAATLSGVKDKQTQKLVSNASDSADRKAITEVTGGTSAFKADFDLNLEKLTPENGTSEFDMEMKILDTFDSYDNLVDYGAFAGGDSRNCHTLTNTIIEKSSAQKMSDNMPGFDPGSSKRVPDSHFKQQTPSSP